MSAMKLLILAASGLALIACAPMQSKLQSSANPWVRPVQTVRHGSDADMLYRAGRVFQDQGRYEEALLAYNQALVDNPSHVEARNGLAVVHALQGRAELAESEFRAAIELAPEAAHLRNNLGFHLMNQGRLMEARAELERALALEPASPVVATNLASVEPVAAPVALNEVRLQTPVADEPVVVTPQPERVVVESTPVETQAVAETQVAEAPGFHVGYRIEVSNGNGAGGLARRTSYLLDPLGFEHTRLTNDKPYGRLESRLQYVAGAQDAARQVNARLPRPLPLAEVPTLERSAKVRVLLGRDFPASDPAILAAKPAKPRA
jgi:tetratricopeptide (TPR) repeat protein